MKFKDYSIDLFLGELSSDLPSPGGGSVSGLIAALSGSLNSMVYSLTVNKKSFEQLDIDIKTKVLNFKESSNKFTQKALALMEKDREEFNKLMEAYKLPKESEEEKNFRSKKIKECTVKAMLAPLTMARECYGFYENIEVATKYGNKMLLSDAACAASLLHSAIETSIINVKVNLSSLVNENNFIEIKLEVEKLQINSQKRKEDILAEINKEIFPY